MPLQAHVCPQDPVQKIARTAYDEQYRRAYARQHSKRGKQMKKLRQSTVEPVFGSLVQHYGLRKFNVLGKSGAHKVILLAAAAFNLRKYMKFKPTKSKSMVMALEEEQQQQAFQAVLLRLQRSSSIETKKGRVERSFWELNARKGSSEK